MTDSMDLKCVRAVLARRRQEIIDRYGAQGVGVGREPEGHVIVVYLRSARQRPQQEERIDGVRLKFEVTGPFTTQKL